MDIRPILMCALSQMIIIAIFRIEYRSNKQKWKMVIIEVLMVFAGNMTAIGLWMTAKALITGNMYVL